MKILNLYAGIGGNRKLWGEEHDITAVEIDPKIAEIYCDFFPKDKMIIADAHQYLLEHFKEFNFIWSSPPCPSHSEIRKISKPNGKNHKPIYPNMKLYEEILFLQGYFKGKWCVENVISWYNPLIKPFEIGRHYYWSNFFIGNIKPKASNIEKGIKKQWEKELGFNLDKWGGVDKRKMLRNCVEPGTGLHILNESIIDYQSNLFR